MVAPKTNQWLRIFIVAVWLAALFRPPSVRADSPLTTQADDPSPPTSPVKLVFVHHSTGGNWLADDNGGLGLALQLNNYYVSATNYGWGPDTIGDRTDIPNWPEWFTGPNHAAVLSALYNETGQNEGGFGAWSRLASDPGGENEIILFKSCFPNSALAGSPADAAYASPNDWELSVSNAKAVYNNLLTYFATRPDRLFVVITAPPLAAGETNPTHAANARAFNTWLVNDWLTGYSQPNVAVFDYYNVLTSNAGDADTSDVGQVSGNHHRWWNGAVQHQQTVSSNTAAYPSGDSHPSAAGHQKATTEFVPLLNVFYQRWKAGTTSGPALSLTAPRGGEHWPIASSQQIRWTTRGTVTQVNLYYASEGLTTTLATNLTNNGVYTWLTPITATTIARVRVESVISPSTVYAVSAAPFVLCQPDDCAYSVFLPLILKE